MKNFKRIITVVIPAILLATLFISASLADVFAAIEGFTQFHDENAPRVTDRAGILGDEFEKEIAARIAASTKSCRMDFVVLTVEGFSPKEFGDDVVNYYKQNGTCYFDDYLSDYFDYNGYGYGEDFSGIIFGIDMDPDDRQYWFVTTGSAIELYQDRIRTLKANVQPLLSDGNYEGAVTYFLDYAEDVAKSAIINQKYEFEGVTPIRSDTVYDEAGVLTASDISSIKRLVEPLSEAFDYDIVFLTVKDGFSAADFGDDVKAFYDSRDAGYTLSDFAADYFNSHGFGKTETRAVRSGLIYAVQKTSSGIKVGCYTKGEYRVCDFGKHDEIEPYVAGSKDYVELAEKLRRYTELVIALETGGSSYPDHLVKRGETDANRPLVIDKAGLFTEEYIKKLEKKLAKKQKSCKADIVVMSVMSYDATEFGPEVTIGVNHGFYGAEYDLEEYARDYLIYHGYGVGHGHEAVILALDGSTIKKSFAIATIGSKTTKLFYNVDDIEILETAVRSKLRSVFGDQWKKATNTFVTYSASKLILKHFPLSIGNFIAAAIIAGLISAIVTAVKTSGSDNNAKMAPDTTYVDSQSLNIRDVNSIYVRTSTTRVYHESSSSSGGRSGGGGHSSGSSGVCHGGGGGRF